VSSNKCADSFGNANAGIVSTNYSIDQTRPECTIARTGESLTKANTVGFTITFTEDVTGFTEDDITLHKTGTEGSLSGFSGSGKDYSVNVINITGDGAIGISVSQGNAVDIAGNGNMTGAQVDYEIDNTAPSVAISDPSTSLTASGPVNYTVTYSGADSVSLATNDVTLNPSSPPSGGYAAASRTGPSTGLLRLRSAQVRAGTANGTVSVSGSGTGTRTVTISGITGDGTLGITVAANTAQDTAGNEAGSVTGTCFSVDNTAPSVTITSTTESTVNTFPIPVSVRFSEAVTGFSIEDVTVGNGTAGNFVTVSASSYTFDLTPSITGSVTAEIAANVAHDAMGHGNSAASQFSRTYEISVPMSVSATDGDHTDRVRVTWDAVTGATSYEVWRSTSDSSSSASKLGDASDTTYDDTSAETDITYYYWVKARNSLGTSASSDSDSGWRRSSASTDNADSDLDGDGLVDLTVYHEESGCWYMLLSASGEVASQKFGEPGYSPVPGDFDGDGKTDLAVYHESSGYWYILPSSTYTLSYQKFGASGYEPVLGDYDGDGKSDLAVYQESSGYWYILPSATYSLSYQQFGALGYSPVQGDYDGDGKTDLAVYHESLGYWYILQSSSYELSYMQFGASGYNPAPADYDGDGQADLAVYQESSGYWYIWLSGSATLSYQKLGESGYSPVTGDYDGDGKADLAVYHESSGYWFILLSETGSAV
ncbi:FG-GAP-like repeat-containing protein, partial [Verrucomicrobiota bacterium]